MTQWLNNLYQWKRVKRKHQTGSSSKNNRFPDFQFTLEELIALNENLQLAKYDLAVMNSAPLMIAKGIDFLFDYKLYQFSETSLIRKYPVRILINNKTGSAVEVTGDNEAIYGIFKEIFATQFNQPNMTESEIHDKIVDWVRANIFKYTLFFFDNIRGSNGRFELVSDFQEIQDRIETYYKLNVAHQKSEDALDQDDPNRVEKGNLLIKGIFDYLKDHEITFKFEKQLIISGLLMVFKNSLFAVDLTFNNSPDRFGQINLDNQRIISLEDSKIVERPFGDVDKHDGFESIPLRITSYS